MAPWRPRDRKWMAERTCKGIGRHGEGNWEEEMRLEILEESVIVDDGVDAFDESIDQPEELVGVEEVDQELGDPLLEDPPLHLHPRRPASHDKWRPSRPADPGWRF